jgi:glycosyltransferase involved in cell wall biosynthesis
MEGAPRLSIVVPFYNEADNVEPLHRELDAALADLPGGVEFVYVDDGSADDTGARLLGLAKRDPRIRVLRLSPNSGQSAAFEAGFRRCAARDRSRSTGPAERAGDIPRLLAELERFDVVNGVRVNRRDGWLRKLSSRIGNGFRNWVTRESVTDVGCSLRAMRSEYVKRMKLFRGMHRFLPTLLRMEGATVTEIPVSHRPRRHGSSKYGVGNRAFVGFVDVLAVRWMQAGFAVTACRRVADGSRLWRCCSSSCSRRSSAWE